MKKLLVLTLALVSTTAMFAGSCFKGGCAKSCAPKCERQCPAAGCNPPAPRVTCERTWSCPTFVRQIHDVVSCETQSCPETKCARCVGYEFVDCDGGRFSYDGNGKPVGGAEVTSASIAYNDERVVKAPAKRARYNQ